MANGVSKRIYNARDVRRLRHLLKRAQGVPERKEEACFLAELLERGRGLDSRNIPCDVVTMNSEACLKSEASNTVVSCTLVYPEKADPSRGRISVLSPVGAAVLGCRVGHTIECHTPSGRKRIRIERILYQPEALGHL